MVFQVTIWWLYRVLEFPTLSSFRGFCKQIIVAAGPQFVLLLAVCLSFGQYLTPTRRLHRAIPNRTTANCQFDIPYPSEGCSNRIHTQLKSLLLILSLFLYTPVICTAECYDPDGFNKEINLSVFFNRRVALNHSETVPFSLMFRLSSEIRAGNYSQSFRFSMHPAREMERVKAQSSCLRVRLLVFIGSCPPSTTTALPSFNGCGSLWSCRPVDIHPPPNKTKQKDQQQVPTH